MACAGIVFGGCGCDTGGNPFANTHYFGVVVAGGLSSIRLYNVLDADSGIFRVPANSATGVYAAAVNHNTLALGPGNIIPISVNSGTAFAIANGGGVNGLGIGMTVSFFPFYNLAGAVPLSWVIFATNLPSGKSMNDLIHYLLFGT